MELQSIDRDGALLLLEARMLALRKRLGDCALASINVIDVPGASDKVHLILQWSSSAHYNTVKSWLDKALVGITVPRGGQHVFDSTQLCCSGLSGQV